VRLFFVDALLSLSLSLTPSASLRTWAIVLHSLLFLRVSAALASLRPKRFTRFSVVTDISDACAAFALLLIEGSGE